MTGHGSDALPPGGSSRDELESRVDNLAEWIADVDARARTLAAATGDEDVLEELRATVKALSKIDPELERRLADQFENLSERVSSLSETVKVTTGGLAGKDGELVTLRRRLDDEAGRIEQIAADLGRKVDAGAIRELRETVDALAAREGARPARGREVKKFDDMVEDLSERVSSLSETVKVTAGGLAGKDGQIAALHLQLEEQQSRGKEALAGLGQAFAALSAELTTLRARASSDAVGKQIDGHIVGLTTRVKALAGQVETLSRTVEATTISQAANGDDVSDIRRELEKGNERLESFAEELRRQTAVLPARAADDPVLAAELDGLAGRVDGFARQFESVERRVSEQAAALTAVDETGQLAHRLIGELSDRLGAFELDRDTVAAEVTQAQEAWASERAELASQIDAVATAQAELSGTSASSAEVDEKVADLVSRLDGMERGRAEVAEEVTRVAGAWTAERAALEERLEELATALAETAGDPDAETVRLVSDLARRLDGIERQGADVAAKVARTSAEWTSELTAVGTRLEEVAAAQQALAEAPVVEIESALGILTERLEDVERHGAALASEIARASAVWGTELASIETRLDEASRAASESRSELGPVLADVTRRLADVEHDRDSVANEVERVSALWASERALLHVQLRSLAEAERDESAALSPEAEALIAALAARIEGVESQGAAVTAEVTRASEAWTSELGSIEARIDDAVRAWREWAEAAGPDEATEQQLAVLSARLEQVESDKDAVADEVVRAVQRWGDERTAIETRLDELAAQLTEPHAATEEETSASSEDMTQLRDAIEGLRMRLAQNERELAALAGTQEVLARLEELASRVEGLEAGDALPRVATPPDAEDGLARRDMQALAVRLDRAEHSSRDKHEALLTQLERIASRIDWRLQSLAPGTEGQAATALVGTDMAPL